MEIYEKLKPIAEKFKLSKADKEFIEPLASEHNITINNNCSDCWRDAAIQLLLIYKPEEEPKQDAGGYELRDGIDITLHSFKHGTFRVCKATLTKENAEKWIAAGIPLRFFKRLPENAGNGQD